MPSISHLSNQTVFVPVRNAPPITGEQDISALGVEFAVVALGTDPADSDWFTAAWMAGTQRVGRKNYYVAYAEVGPTAGTVELAAGLYRVWVRVDAATETPVLSGPTLTVI